MHCSSNKISGYSNWNHSWIILDYSLGPDDDEEPDDKVLQASKKGSPSKTTKKPGKGKSKTTTSAPEEEEEASKPLPKKLPCPPKSKAKKCKKDNECKYAYPGECNVYIKCDDKGGATVEDCPMGLEWKDDQKICAFPLFSKCSQPGDK